MPRGGPPPNRKVSKELPVIQPSLSLSFHLPTRAGPPPNAGCDSSESSTSNRDVERLGTDLSLPTDDGLDNEVEEPETQVKELTTSEYMEGQIHVLTKTQIGA